MVKKKFEHPVWAILNFFQSFHTKMVKKTSKQIILAKIGHSEFLSVFLHQNGLKTSGTPKFGHSNFLKVFLHQNVSKNWNAQFWPKLAIPDFFQSFYTNMVQKIQNAQFWPKLAIPKF